MLILPYIEQGNLYEMIDVTKAALSTVNMPPNNPAYSTPIKTFLCPTALVNRPSSIRPSWPTASTTSAFR